MRTSTSTAPPSADDLAEGIVGPMDIPIDKPIPILCLKKREYLRRREKAQSARRRREHCELEGRAPYVQRDVKRLRRLKRLRSNNGLPVTTLPERAQELQGMDEEFHVAKNMSVGCVCRSCRDLRRWSSTLRPYRCKDKNCRITFESFTDLYEHQLQVHGGLDPRANRVVSDTFHQQRGSLVFPPATVYAGQQFMFPSRPPIPWKSMEELDEEAKTVRDKLRDYNRYCFDTPHNRFDTGYKLVKRHGWREMQRQYHIAMEHFYSGMKFPASSRGFHDGCPSVERGRNWLTSTDREDSRFLFPFSVGDKIDVEPEFILIDTQYDQEMEGMYIDLNDGSDDEDSSTSGKTDREEETFKKDDDVKMKAPEGDEDDFNPVKEQKVFDIDGNEGEPTAERKVFDAESDNDSDITVMSEVDGDNYNDKVMKFEDNGSDSASDSESDVAEEEVELKASRGVADETVSASDSSSSSDDEVASKGGIGSVTVSDSDSDSESESDDDVQLNAFKGRNDSIVSASDTESDSDSGSDLNSSQGKTIHEVISSSEDSSVSESDTESKAPRRNQLVSDSDSESDAAPDDIFNQLE